MSAVTQVTVSVLPWQTNIPITAEGLAVFMVRALAHAETPVGPDWVQPMNPMEKGLWLSELANPDAKQTIGKLTVVEPDGSLAHCCWGLYCQAMDLSFTEMVNDDGPGIVRQYEFPVALARRSFFGQSSIDPDFAAEHGLDWAAVQGLEAANDVGFPFDLISAWIGRNL